mgnify:FL=1
MIVVLSAMLAFIRGLVREVMGIGAWIGAGIFSLWAAPEVEPHIRDWLGSADYSKPVAYLVCFLVALVLLSIVAGMIGSVVRGSLLSGIDRTLGVVFGALRGVALLAVAYIVVGLLVPPLRWPPPVQEARALPYVQWSAGVLARCVPESYRPTVAPLPTGGRETTAADLMRVPAVGRATGRQP